ncbi:hypothetical protein COCOBI_02-5810 [Coccomyxa sp. Obi]|nr:hypothetical protein COCOBI_02-5810 [Coccomyxa sp. Obi]
MVQDPPVYHLEDRSTNGTAINGARVPKGTSKPLVEGDRIRFAVATQDPNKIIEYIFRRVPDGRISRSTKRVLDTTTPDSNAKRIAKKSPDPKMVPQTVPQTDTAVMQKLRQSNDELRQKVEAERQANMEAGMKVKELEQLLKTERKSFKHQLADAKKTASNEGIRESAELKSRLTAAEAQAQREAAACAEAKEETSAFKAAAERAQKEFKKLSADQDELTQRVHTLEASHRAAIKTLDAAEKSARRELQTKTEMLEQALDAKAAAEGRAHDEAVARSAAEQREQELQRDMWELKLKLQRAEDACTAVEEKTLCLESFVREGVSNVGRASKRGTEQQLLLTDLQAMATKITGILDKIQSESTAANDEMVTAKYNLECALSVRDAEPGRDMLPRGEPAGTQQPTQSMADGSGGSVPAGLASPSKSSSRGIATQPRSPPPHQLPAMSLTLGPDTGAAPPAAEPTQVKEEEMNNGHSRATDSAAAVVADSEGGAAEGCKQEDASAGAMHNSSFVLNGLIGGQPRSSVNTPSFGNGSAPQQPASGNAQCFAATLADAAGSAGQPADVDMEDRGPDEERENVPANGAVDGEKACAPVEKKGSQKGGISQSAKPALQLSLQGRDRYGVESHGDEFDDME